MEQHSLQQLPSQRQQPPQEHILQHPADHLDLLAQAEKQGIQQHFPTTSQTPMAAPTGSPGAATGVMHTAWRKRGGGGRLTSTTDRTDAFRQDGGITGVRGPVTPATNRAERTGMTCTGTAAEATKNHLRSTTQNAEGRQSVSTMMNATGTSLMQAGAETAAEAGMLGGVAGALRKAGRQATCTHAATTNSPHHTLLPHPALHRATAKEYDPHCLRQGSPLRAARPPRPTQSITTAWLSHLHTALPRTVPLPPSGIPQQGPHRQALLSPPLPRHSTRQL